VLNAMKKVAQAFLLLTLGACRGATPLDLSTEFKETPFRYLPGVQLGMTGRRLHSVRPAAAYAPYLGLQERIRGYTVSYQFPTSKVESSGTDVGPNDALQGIFITETFVSRDIAEKSWHDKVREVSSAKRAPDVCETFPTGGMQARWFSGKTTFAIGAFPREPMAPNVGDRLIYAVSPATTMKQPPGATPIACPNS
jgi:hypothetical protein